MPDAQSERIAVIGDVHGNALALDAALDAVRSAGFDRLVFLGDLLTYGVDSAEVVARVADACAAPEVTLLRGNHDALYLPGEQGYGMPSRPWVVESIEYTRSVAPLDAFERLPFVDELAIGSTYFAHANPFGRGDWRYLNSLADYEEAAAALAARGARSGVFGHTHRARCFIAGRLRPAGTGIRVAAEDMAVLNAGSIGQPRDRPPVAFVLLLRADEQGTRADFLPIHYDVHAHLARIMASPLSDETKSALAGFHRD